MISKCLSLIYSAVMMLIAQTYRVYICYLHYIGPSQAYYDARQRLGYYQTHEIPSNPVIIHAEGVGECNAVLPLLQKIRAQNQYNILVTVLDQEAKTMMQKRYPEYAVVLLPWDTPSLMCKFTTTVQPKAAMIVERGIWPNMLGALQANHIPVMVASARLSDRSYWLYQKLRALITPSLKMVQIWASQSDAVTQKYLHLGVSNEKIQTVGNIKYALAGPSSDILEKADTIRSAWLPSEGGTIFVAVSTHEGEEEIILEAYQRLREDNPKYRLVIIPRHISRVPHIKRLCETHQWHPSCHTDSSIPGKSAIHLVDKIGEVMLFLAAADVAFIGGSLVPKGGHNPLEAAKLGVPCITGPRTDNFTSIWNDLAQLGAHNVVQSPDDIVKFVKNCNTDKQYSSSQAEKVLRFMDQQNQVIEQHIKLWEHLLEEAPAS